ncbi:hypothetical protein JOB18_024077 [Solea senegalensis]|uniref:Uncharacterized protein n=1 Tax=Solea senegalensis TaxID=28829 RepID=A0AAV6QB42_SOLSE|nr:hypothetical protein JOB18_024077 [Solea senegalensis]
MFKRREHAYAPQELNRKTEKGRETGGNSEQVVNEVKNKKEKKNPDAAEFNALCDYRAKSDRLVKKDESSGRSRNGVDKETLREEEQRLSQTDEWPERCFVIDDQSAIAVWSDPFPAHRSIPCRVCVTTDDLRTSNTRSSSCL